MTHNQDIDATIDPQIQTLRDAVPGWTQETIDLAELAANSERAATRIIPEVIARSQKLIVDVAEWQEKLGEWQGLTGGRRAAELRILKATLDACMDEANTAARVLGIQ